RFQFSVEKAYNVRIFTFASTAARTISLTTFIPSLCPALRESPRCFAQRPLPSIIMATWLGTLTKSHCFRFVSLYFKKGIFIDIICPPNTVDYPHIQSFLANKKVMPNKSDRM